MSALPWWAELFFKDLPDFDRGWTERPHNRELLRFVWRAHQHLHSMPTASSTGFTATVTGAYSRAAPAAPLVHALQTFAFTQDNWSIRSTVFLGSETDLPGIKISATR
jgi:hypothetical protein